MDETLSRGLVEGLQAALDAMMADQIDTSMDIIGAAIAAVEAGADHGGALAQAAAAFRATTPDASPRFIADAAGVREVHPANKRRH